MDNVSVAVSHNNDNLALSLVSPSNHPIDFVAFFDLDDALAAADESRRLFAASKTFVSSLPAVYDVSDDDVCSICMEGFHRHNSGEEGNRQVPCGHVYHSNCITVWLSHCSSCPLCRRHISLHFQHN